MVSRSDDAARDSPRSQMAGVAMATGVGRSVVPAFFAGAVSAGAVADGGVWRRAREGTPEVYGFVQWSQEIHQSPQSLQVDAY